MTKRKLEVSEELKLKLEQMREILGAIDPSFPVAEEPGGCGHYCMISCSYYCESTCAKSCASINGGIPGSKNGCAYKYVDICGYYNRTSG